jgi:hypothetical protein
MSVRHVELHYTSLQPSLILAVAGRLSLKAFLVPSQKLRMQMAGALKLHAQHVEVIWAMFSKAKASKLQPMPGTV